METVLQSLSTRYFTLVFRNSGIDVPGIQRRDHFCHRSLFIELDHIVLNPGQGYWFNNVNSLQAPGIFNLRQQ